MGTSNFTDVTVRTCLRFGPKMTVLVDSKTRMVSPMELSIHRGKIVSPGPRLSCQERRQDADAIEDKRWSPAMGLKHDEAPLTIPDRAPRSISQDTFDSSIHRCDALERNASGLAVLQCI